MSENKDLVYEKKSVYELAGKEVVDAAFAYAEDYKKYLDDGKTERESLVASIAIAEANGYREYRLGDKIEAGDRLYYNNRGKNLFLIKVGTEDINNACALAGERPWPSP